MSVVPRLALKIKFLSKKFWENPSEFTIGATFQYLCVIFNVLLAPCIAVCLANSDCFLNVFSPQESVNVALSYPVCAISVAINRNISVKIDPFNVRQSDCLHYTTAPVYEEPFQPPFLYSYQCSSALITAYTPAYVMQYVFNGFVLPLIELSSWYLIRRYLKHRNTESDYSPLNVIQSKICMIDRIRAFSFGMIGNFYWPVSEV